MTWCSPGEKAAVRQVKVVGSTDTNKHHKAHRQAISHPDWCLNASLNTEPAEKLFLSTTSPGDNRHSIHGRGPCSFITSQCCSIFLSHRKTDRRLTIFHSALHTIGPRWRQWPFSLNYFPFNQWHCVWEIVSGRATRGLRIHHASLTVLMDNLNTSLCQDLTNIHQNVERISMRGQRVEKL